MPLFEKDVVLLSATPVTEANTGDNLWSLTFGEISSVTRETAARAIAGTVGPVTPPKVIPVTWITLYVKSEALPYTLGSKWKLKVEADGSISMVPRQ